MKDVNPVFLTAQTCLCVLERAGDPDAKKLNSLLGCMITEPPGLEKVSPQRQAMFGRMSEGLWSALEARYKATNAYFKSEKTGCFVDLGCGFVPRAVGFAREGLRYVGIDLPQVIEKLSPAVSECIGGNSELVTLAVADITDYSALAKALEGIEGELFVSAEGLLPYLSEDEIKVVFGNVRRLLAEHGGVFVTTDPELEKWNRRITSATVSGMIADPKEFVQLSEGNVSDVKFGDNSVCKGSRGDIENAVAGMGFDADLVPLYSYIGGESQLQSLPEDKRAAAYNVYKNICFWVMTARDTGEERFADSKNDFSAEIKRVKSTLYIKLKGRLDTVTSATLLDLFRKASANEPIKRIIISAKDLEYISSAGLRVLMIMVKSLPQKNSLIINYATDSVREIFATTGFDLMFTLR